MRSLVVGLVLTASTTYADSPNRISIDAETSLEGAGYGGSIAFARSVAPQWFAGGGVGFGWEENRHTFDGNIFEALHAEGFVRWAPRELFHVEGGLTAMRFAVADDGGDGGQFGGAYATAAVGTRHVSLASRVRVGRADGEFGAIITPMMLRAMFDW